MVVLVTGSNGFIGGHVVRNFRKIGWSVIGLGRADRPKHECEGYIQCDLNSPKTSLLFSQTDQQIDAVVHLAADMRREPNNVEVVEDNCTGTQRLLEACEKAHVQAFIQLSSLPVIGVPKYLPITENHPICPPTVYHVTKYTEELLADYSSRKHGLRTASFRISALIGIGMNPKTIFPTFVKNAALGKDLVLIGKGGRKQTYIHVDDISQAIIKAIGNDNARGVYNISSRNYLSNLELAKLCVHTLCSKSSIVYSGNPDPMENYCWQVCIEKATKDFGFNPLISLESAIQEYAAYVSCMDNGAIA